MIVSNKTSSSATREGPRTVQGQDHAPNANTPLFLIVQAIQHIPEKKATYTENYSYRR